MIDTHCHMNMVVKKEFDIPLTEQHFPLVAQTVAQAADAGVHTIINVGTSLVESLNCIQIAKRHERVFATVGIHPCDATDSWRDDVAQLKKYVQHAQEHKIVAIGEVGLDFYHKPYDQARQIDAFKAQIELALEFALPLVIHVRDAGDQLLRVLEEYMGEDYLPGVIHCFSQQQDFAEQVIKWGFYVGLDAPIAYPKNVWLADVVRTISLEHILLETDAPFLPPQQFRGKPNFPAYLPYVAQAVADIKGLTLDVVQAVTTQNAQKLFGI